MGPLTCGRGLLAALAACGLGHAAGFATRTIGSSDRPMRWSVNSEPTSTDGLGAGIAWALDPDFASLMVPRFKENNFNIGVDFVTEESLNDAIQRAMFAWANNHKYLTFFNVTDKCKSEGKGNDCSVAELYISAQTGAEENGWVPVKVVHTYNSTSGAEVLTTAGKREDAKGIVKSEIIFYIDHPVEAPDFPQGLQCFYLDETFCEPFQTAQKTYDIKLLIEIICFTAWGMAFLMALKRLAEYVIGYLQKGWEGLKMIARVHAANILYSYTIMLLLIFPPAFYWVAVHPCFLCYGFESLAVGAVGQVLGFDYVNGGDASNQRVTRRMDDDVCDEPHKYVEDAPVDDLSVMKMPDTFNANYCLTQHDLDGLYTLYPICSGAKVTPGCMRSKTNLGYLRVGLAFGVPFAIVSFVIFVSVAILRRVERTASENIKKRLAVNAFASPSPRRSSKPSIGNKFAPDKIARDTGIAGAPGSAQSPFGDRV